MSSLTDVVQALLEIAGRADGDLGMLKKHKRTLVDMSTWQFLRPNPYADSGKEINNVGKEINKVLEEAKENMRRAIAGYEEIKDNALTYANFLSIPGRSIQDFATLKLVESKVHRTDWNRKLALAVLPTLLILLAAPAAAGPPMIVLSFGRLFAVVQPRLPSRSEWGDNVAAWLLEQTTMPNFIKWHRYWKGLPHDWQDAKPDVRRIREEAGLVAIADVFKEVAQMHPLSHALFDLIVPLIVYFGDVEPFGVFRAWFRRHQFFDTRLRT